jgi:uncharacterized membrane protein
MTHYIIAYFGAALTFLIIDAVWLGVVAKPFFSKYLGYLLADDIKFSVAAAFYVTYAIGIVVFAIKPALSSGQVTDVIIYGALFGFLAYGTYDFTNLATIRDWPIIVTVVDVAWGTFLTTISALAGYYAVKMIKG